MEKKNIIICVVVWGDSFFQVFNRISLPCYLARGNIPKISHESNVSFLIFADKSILGDLEKSSTLRRVKEFIPLEIKLMEINNKLSSYENMTNYHQQAVRNLKYNDIIIFLNPDTIFSQNYLSCIASYINDNTDAVFVHNFRVNLEDTFYQLEQSILKNGILELSEPDLVKLAIENIHDSSKPIFWDKEQNGFSSWHICAGNNSNFVSKTFHPHPAAIRIKKFVRNFDGTIDHELPIKATRGSNFFKTVKSSDEGVIFELSAQSYSPFKNDNYEAILLDRIPEKAAIWAARWTYKHHLELVKETVFFFSEPHEIRTKSEMKEECNKITEIVDRITTELSSRKIFKQQITNILLSKKIVQIMDSPLHKFQKNNLIEICLILIKNKFFILEFEKEHAKKLKQSIKSAFHSKQDLKILQKAFPNRLKMFFLKKVKIKW